MTIPYVDRWQAARDPDDYETTGDREAATDRAKLGDRTPVKLSLTRGQAYALAHAFAAFKDCWGRDEKRQADESVADDARKRAAKRCADRKAAFGEIGAFLDSLLNK